VKKKINCGDWHLTWGMSTTLIGKLEQIDDHTFVWRGKSQGRHGQVWWKGAKITFNFKNEDITITSINKGRLPKESELRKSINELILNNDNKKI
jgi:hypothetical protein